MRKHSIAGAALGAAFLSLAGSALAQSNTEFATNRLDPAAAGDAFFAVPSAETNGKFKLHAMLFTDYALRPFVVTTTDGTRLASVVDNQLNIHGNIGVTLFDRVALNVDVPGAIQSGEAFGQGATTLPKTRSTGAGNVRVSARGRIWGETGSAAVVGLGGYLYVPTTGDYLSDSLTRGWVHALVSGDVASRIRYAVAFGPEIRQGRSLLGVDQGSRFTYSAAIGATFGADRQFQIGPEVLGTMNFSGVEASSTNIDILGGAKYRFQDEFTLGLGGGAALTTGIGSAAARGMLSLTWSPNFADEKQVCTDNDGDTIPDAQDACPALKGTTSATPAKNGCPAVDSDADGFFDDTDACPTEKGVFNADPTKNGCAIADSDGDGFKDDVDACPAEKGVANTDPKKNGCAVADSDGDGLKDDVDACPAEKGVANADPKKNGCAVPDTDSDSFKDDVDACPKEAGPDNADPTKRGCPVRALLDRNLQGVEFDTGKATIRPSSDASLDAAAALLKEHPELTNLEVQGHTDNVGDKRRNKALSAERARAVVAALTKRGIAGNRLAANGFGDEQPIETNDTPEGRQKNRRVQFKILEQKK